MRGEHDRGDLRLVADLGQEERNDSDAEHAPPRCRWRVIVVELVGLVQNLGRRLHLADVVHESRQAELPQLRTVNPEAARLAHRQDRHVHHVGKRVVVVVLQRREREQRGSVLGHRLRQRIDNSTAGAGIGLTFALRAIPESARHRDGIVVKALECRDITHRRIDTAFHLQAPDADVEQGGQGGELARVRGRQRLNELRDFWCLDAAVDDDSLDAGLLQPAYIPLMSSSGTSPKFGLRLLRA